MAGICSIDRGFDPSCKLCRSIFNAGLYIYCVMDTYDEPATIEYAFLTQQEASDFVNKSGYFWYKIDKIKVTL